jgi:hypothetical protein
MSVTAVEHVISCDPKVFRENLNLLPFEVQHSLADNPLFDVSALVGLAQRVAERKNPHRMFGDVYFNVGSVEAGQKPHTADKPDVPVTEIMKQLEETESWVVLEHVEREPDYREVLEDCICDLLELSGKDLLKNIKWFDAILFITSPHRKTSYHIDRECGWLLQLRGEKAIHLFNRSDKELVPDRELEIFWAKDNSAAIYKPELESRAMVFDLVPGTGVHIPVNTPHWLENGNNVSVSMNINFQFQDHVWGNIYKANYFLRKAGLNPKGPGGNPLVDRVKSLSYTTVQQVSHQLKKKTPVPPEARQDYERIAKKVLARS